MKRLISIAKTALVGLSSVALVSCASSYNAGFHGQHRMGYIGYSPSTNYGSRLPSHIETNGRKTIYVDPNKYAWGAYNAQGELVKAGIATSGGKYCEDIDEPCMTTAGTYTIKRIGGADCKSSQFPLPDGGGLMPHCMFFNKGQALHGSPDGAVVEANISHGCVRMRIPDAEWLRFNFAGVGTKVVIAPY